MKIYRHNDNGFVYYEAVAKGIHILAFRITDLINQLWTIYAIDLRAFLFNPKQAN